MDLDGSEGRFPLTRLAAKDSKPRPQGHTAAAPAPAPGVGRTVAVAMYDFEADGGDEVTAKKDEKLTVLDKEGSDEWWKCRNSKGEEGVFPASYLEIEPAGEIDDNAVVEVAAEASGAARAALAEAAQKGQEKQAREAQERQEATAQWQREEKDRAREREAEALARASSSGTPNKPGLFNPFFEFASGPRRIVAATMYDFEADADDELTAKEGEKLIVLDKEGSDEWWKCRNSKGQEGVFPVPYLELELADEVYDNAGVEVAAEAARTARAALAEAVRKERERTAGSSLRCRLITT